MADEADNDKPTFDIDKAVAYLKSHASAESKGQCARSIRLALEAGGVKLAQRPVYAKDYGIVLAAAGFTRVASRVGHVPKKGDIAVIQNYEGGSAAGHITMYSGTDWYSDFKQRDMWSGPGYREHKPDYEIYRWEE